jgi:DNA-binding NarL/FixJ family response regulator
MRLNYVSGRGMSESRLMAEETTETPGPRPLTRRERQIATLASKGVPNGKIAKRLGLSVRTIESHLYRVYGKLGVSTRDKLPPLLGALFVVAELA